jgi:hypothetical protein
MSGIAAWRTEAPIDGGIDLHWGGQRERSGVESLFF